MKFREGREMKLDLFNNSNAIKELDFDIPMANKIESNYHKETKRQKESQRATILNLVKRYNKITQRQIHEISGIPRHLVSRAIKNIVDEPFSPIKISGSEFDPVTNRTVTTYSLK